MDPNNPIVPAKDLHVSSTDEYEGGSTPVLLGQELKFNFKIPNGPVIPLPLVVVSGISCGMFVLLPLLVGKGPNQGITRCCIMLTVFSMWIFWATVYISQMRPLLGPRMHNTTLAWIKYAWMGQGINESTDLDGHTNNENIPLTTDNNAPPT